MAPLQRTCLSLIGTSISKTNTCPIVGTTHRRSIVLVHTASNAPLRRAAAASGTGLRARPQQKKKYTRPFHSTPSHFAIPKDPYASLGVNKSASASEIKKAYYALAKKFHPDTNKEKGAQERFVEIQNAYDVLGDEKKRQQFDKYGPASQQPGFNADAYERATSGGFGGAGGFADFFGGAAGGGPSGINSDIFDSLFSAFGGGGARGGFGGARAQQQQSAIGDDIQIAITISFEEACQGTSRSIDIRPIVDCRTCKGDGLKPGKKRETCTVCHGTGQQTQYIDAGFAMASTCSSCRGAGEKAPPGSSCDSCAGLGRVRERKTLSVEIPAGIEDGMKVAQAGKGDMPVGIKGRPGDLLVRVNVMPSKTFRRQGANLYLDQSIPFYTAILGGQIRIPTLEGQVAIKVPRGTQAGEEMSLRQRGVKKLSRNRSSSERGDLFVRFNLNVPRTLTPRQRELLESFRDEAESPSTSSNSNTKSSSSSSSPSSSQTSSSSSSEYDSEKRQNSVDQATEDEEPEKKTAAGSS